MTRPTAAPEPVNCSTNQSKAMMVNWSPRYEILSPSQSRWNAGWRNGAPTAVVSSLFTFMYLRSNTRRRFPLQFDLIVINGGTDEIFWSTLIHLIALEKIDRSPRVASESRVEELVRICEARPMGKGKLHLIFVRIADRDHSIVRPHGASHPLPFLDDLPVGLKDGLADAGERLPAPVCESCDQLVNTFRWIHWVFKPPILVPFSFSSKEVVEVHGLSTSIIPKGQLQARRQTE